MNSNTGPIRLVVSLIYGVMLVLVPVTQVTAFATITAIRTSAPIPSSSSSGAASFSTRTTMRRMVEEDRSIGFSQQVMDEAADALVSVGWSAPSSGDAELTSSDPFVQSIDASIQRDIGVRLDELLNPAKVVNLERDLYNLRSELATLTGKGDLEVAGLLTETCDGGGGGQEADDIRAKISKKEKDLAIERRSVFRGWLKNIFLIQAVLSLVLSYVMATDPAVLFGGYGWFYSYNMDTSIRVLGFWWWWLFVVPSLRSRRPSGAEKKALDIAFLGTPLISILAPLATKDTGIIWAANFAVVAASYAFAFASDTDDDDDDSSKPEWLKFIYKSLDFGTGRERGARQ